MRFNTGDIVFTPDGRPALVTGRKETGHIVVDRKGEKLDKARKNGIINGLSSQDRQKFNEVVNKAKEQPAPENRVKEIQAKVDEIDGKPKNWILFNSRPSDLNPWLSYLRIRTCPTTNQNRLSILGSTAG